MAGLINSQMQNAARQGRNGDTQLAHVNPQEAALLKSLGGSGTINPKTGLREFSMTADQAAELMRRSQVGGVPTAEFDAGGGYDAVKALAAGNTTGYQAGIRTVADMAKYAPDDVVDRVEFNQDSGQNETFYASGNSATGGELPSVTPVTPVTPLAAVTALSAAPVTGVAANTPLADTAQAYTATKSADVVAGNTAASSYNAQQANASLQAPAETYTADKATAANWDVTAPQTVQSQIRDIIAADSILRQQADTRVLQRGNARGLVNTGMMLGEAEGELYKAATPIAQQDASTYARSGEFNAANRQQTSLANQNAANTAGQWNAGARNLVSSQNSQLQTNVNLTNAAQTNQALQFNAATATEVSKINVANALQSGIVNQAQANEVSKFNANLLTTVDLANTNDANIFQQFSLDQAFKAKVINQEQYNAMSKFNADAKNTFRTAINLAATNAAAATAANTQAVLMSKTNADSQVRINRLSDAAKAKAVGIADANDNLIKTNSLAAAAFNQALGAISAIETNDKMNATTKTHAVAGVWRDVASQMDVLGGVAGINLKVRDQLKDYPGFDANGKWVGFGDIPTTTGFNWGG